ncbi:hypothetical protein LGV61_02040 [Desulfurispirillum indicum]|uniref:COG3014 family protein n=1 Tax=Desulfurispirillum indicum TaxID=936456 RepID=UPI001CF9809A|nr:hypothetical protein [Desulfurispirillum indicum]UCZ57079.1 hypothetical protein LGV61_02040 [Desulfurispirillum indicum]
MASAVFRRPLLPWVLLAAMLSGGCATYSDSFLMLERSLQAQNPREALQHLERTTPGSRNQVLHLLNRGMLLRMDGEFAQSNRSLEEAKNLMEKLRAVSISEQFGSFVLNDSTMSYVGEEFEQVLVHLYKSLNYLELGEPDSARVEALQVDIKLLEMAQAGFTGNYREDALARYITGMVYEIHREYSDALIAYRRSYETYQEYARHFGVAPPGQLRHDLLRMAHRIGYREELERLQQEFGMAEWEPPALTSGHGEVVVILSSGLAPIKREESALIQHSPNRVLRISLPTYEARPRAAHGVRLRTGQPPMMVSAERAHDINAVALNTLQAKMGAITARAIARMVAKDQTVKEVQEQAGPLAGFIANIASIATETADTRSWLTLPQEIHMVRLSLPAGEHELQLEILGAFGQVVDSLRLESVTVEAGGIAVLSPHWIPSHLSHSPRR